jgi:ABC-type uncharacterized transport system substrate-binding protein
MQADVAGALSLAPEVIVSGGTVVTRELQQRTSTIPIVFVNVGDPIGSGLVRSLAQPGGNVTGIAAGETSIGSKWLEFLKEVAPRVKEVFGTRRSAEPNVEIPRAGGRGRGAVVRVAADAGSRAQFR